MAGFQTGGISAELGKFERLARTSEKACKSAVKAGGKLLAEKLAAAAPVDTGALSRSIKAGGVTYSAGDGYSCDIAPKGKNHGEPLAKIGNIIEYGHGSVAPRPWFQPTVDANSTAVVTAMREAFLADLGGGK